MFTGKTNRRTVILVSGLLCAVAVAGVILWQYEPTAESFYLKCAFHTWTGGHCPGCGTTRALHHLVHGRFIDAVRCNPLLIVGGPIIAILIYRQRRRERITGVVSPRLAWAIYIVITANFIGRNVPSPTRSWLAPPPVSAETEDALPRENRR